MVKEQILGIVRHVLTAVGAILVVKGYIDEGTVTLVIGALLTATGGIWSIFDKKEEKVLERAEAILQSRMLKK